MEKRKKTPMEFLCFKIQTAYSILIVRYIFKMIIFLAVNTSCMGGDKFTPTTIIAVLISCIKTLKLFQQFLIRHITSNTFLRTQFDNIFPDSPSPLHTTKASHINLLVLKTRLELVLLRSRPDRIEITYNNILQQQIQQLQKFMEKSMDVVEPI